VCVQYFIVAEIHPVRAPVLK